jgi:glycerol-3-phosphate dehydrogenase (NAD(P)+)
MADSGFEVLILGYGEMGHALERLLGARHRLRIWRRREPGLDPAAAAATSDFALFCLPANPHRELAERLRPALRTGAICLSVAKGLDDDGRSAAQVFAEVFGGRVPYALLYGPMIAEEIRAGRPAFAECGCASPETYERVRALFQGAPLALRRTDDVAGISWSAVLKNVYALLFGAADELDLGDNMRGYLATAALAELDRLVTALGGKSGTAAGLAGLGDLVTTATSAGSHHHELGRRLARGETAGLSGEGLHTLTMVRRHRLFDPDDFPLYRLAEYMAGEPAGAAMGFRTYLERLYRSPDR